MNIRRWTIWLAAILIWTATPLLLLEILLRLLPVQDDFRTQPVNQQHPNIHHQANRDVTFAKGWNFAIIARKHSNNYGYFSDIDYVRNGKPLLVVIGDSFVEAAQVAHGETMHGLLDARMADRGRVYGIGFSGSPLSQYLAFAEFAKKEFAPQAMVITVVGNDFDESLLKNKQEPGFHYFARQPSGDLALQRVDYSGPQPLRQLVKSSVLMRYLLLTVGIHWRNIADKFQFQNTPLSVTGGTGPAIQTAYVGNTRASYNRQRLEESWEMMAAFFKELPVRSGLPADRILFVLDGMRPHLYTEAGRIHSQNSYISHMRDHFLQQAHLFHYETIDMQDIFIDDYGRHGQTFEFASDYHWNQRGHRLVADAIANSRMLKKEF